MLTAYSPLQLLPSVQHEGVGTSVCDNPVSCPVLGCCMSHSVCTPGCMSLCVFQHTLFLLFMMQRATGATKMNEVSSRSHAVCIIIVEKCSNNSEEQMMMPAWSQKMTSHALQTGQQSIKVSRNNEMPEGVG